MRADRILEDAAPKWDEDQHNRDHGKFSKTNHPGDKSAEANGFKHTGTEASNGGVKHQYKHANGNKVTLSTRNDKHYGTIDSPNHHGEDNRNITDPEDAAAFHKDLQKHGNGAAPAAKAAVGGQDAGKMELVKTPVKEARSHAEQVMKANGRDLNKEIPNFDKNYEFAQKQAATGQTQRKDMPVIDSEQAKQLQSSLQQGEIDVRKPWNPHKKHEDPFPEGLSGEQAQQWLTSGLKKFDGSDPDDKVTVDSKKAPVGGLHPIQKQIYFDKSMEGIAKNGAENSQKFFQSDKCNFITSQDDHIIDGHHRYLSGMLINPDMEVNCVSINLPIKDLLPLTKAYGDAIGNKRNEDYKMGRADRLLSEQLKKR